MLQIFRWGQFGSWTPASRSDVVFDAYNALYLSFIIGSRGLRCEDHLQYIMFPGPIQLLCSLLYTRLKFN